jgi:hypothetical protein
VPLSIRVTDGGQYGARGHMTSRVCPFETPALSHSTSLSDRAQQQFIFFPTITAQMSDAEAPKYSQRTYVHKLFLWNIRSSSETGKPTMSPDRSNQTPQTLACRVLNLFRLIQGQLVTVGSSRTRTSKFADTVRTKSVLSLVSDCP